MTDNSATWYFNLHWQNDYALYHAVLGYARSCLRRVPSMTDQTLGRNVRDTVQRWCTDETATTVIGWQDEPYTISPDTLRMMREEVERAHKYGFLAVSETEIAEEVREGLGNES